ncbi:MULTISPECIES: YgfZ/GcvT domain-containing protein [unclassified Psychrobacter]|uniref:CAF17-like 4Fe-4S cluster assembly/insertion protein YgfZ n=1 Tax=unclassified Psychrobacter TaxID=196806 RepID=UPI0018F31D0B|nr:MULTISPECIES: folate-binding Fe/S cluster repair protein [unclassified Psychrobacter]
MNDITAEQPQFVQLSLQGEDAEKFLQGQLTCDVSKLGLSYQPTAISNLKGRISFGIWIKKQAEKHFDIVISADCGDALQQHLRKFGAFSKFTTSAPEPIYPCVLSGEPTFSHLEDHNRAEDTAAWVARSLETGNYWITAATQDMFQPQELRLHQRGGVDYDKGCYLGQEVIARIYFKAAPKAFLHYVKGTGAAPNAGDKLEHAHVVNVRAVDDGFVALVTARPDKLADSELQVLDLPAALQADVARSK